jgi:hypothetical protein
MPWIEVEFRGLVRNDGKSTRALIFLQSLLRSDSNLISRQLFESKNSLAKMAEAQVLANKHACNVKLAVWRK